MPRRNYYLVLGVSQNECAEGVRDAFRELALKYHPDRAGPGSMRFFQEIIEAYKTLSDPIKRASYDRGLTHGSPHELAVEKTPVHYGSTRRRNIVEQLIPQRERYFRGMRSSSRVFEDIFESVLGSFLRHSVPEREIRPLDMTLDLSEEEAWRGGIYFVELPVFWPCPACKGVGHVWGAICQECDETGLQEERRTVQITIPSGVPNGAVLNLALRGLGVHNLYLRIHIKVNRH